MTTAKDKSEVGAIVAVDLPRESLISAVPYHDHVDAFRVVVDAERFPNVDAFARAFSKNPPSWIRSAMNARDAVVGLFGLKTSRDIEASAEQPELEVRRLAVGDRAGIFRIVERTDNEILAGEDDRHLNFRVSLLYEKKKSDGSESGGNETSVTVSTVVRFNNFFGRAYFLPVRPVHGLIVPAMLRSTIASAG